MLPYSQPPLWYCILFAFYTAGLVLIVRDGIRRKRELSTGSFAVRVFGGGFLLLIALAGVLAQFWPALRLG